MDRKIEIGLLYSFYGNMLTKRQSDCIELYCNEDLSLSEISEHMGITRQGVRDNIVRAERTLNKIEYKLGLARKFSFIKENLEHVDNIIADIERSPDISHLSDDIKYKINEILVIVKNINETEFES